MAGARRGARPALRRQLAHGQRVVGVARVGAHGVARRGRGLRRGRRQRRQRGQRARAGRRVQRRVGVAVARRVRHLLQFHVLLRAGRLRGRHRHRYRPRRGR